MNDTHIGHVEMDDVLRELRAELDVAPSPEFAAKVRARVAGTPSASWAPRWVLWGTLAATAAGVIAFATTRPTVSTAVAVPPAVVTAAVTPPVASAHLPEEVAAPVAEAPPARRRLAPKPAPKAPAHATTTPVLEVITNQPALIRRAFEQAALQREYPVNQPAIPGPIEPLTLTKVVIDPIVIPGSAAPPGGVSPVIRRVSAVDATRSPK